MASRRRLAALMAAAFAAATVGAEIGRADSSCAGTGVLTGSCIEGADGDQVAQGAGTLDWRELLTADRAAEQREPSPDDVFTAGAGEQPDTWRIGAGQVPNGASDLTDLWHSLEHTDAGPILHIALLHAPTAGDSFQAIELDQKPSVANADGVQVPARSIGDLLVTLDSVGGVANIGMCRWVGTASLGRWLPVDGEGVPPTRCSPLAAPKTLGALSSAALAGPDDPLGHGAPLAVGTFGEVSLNLKLIFGPPGDHTCGAFGTLSAHSRTGQSLDSAVGDYILPRRVFEDCTPKPPKPPEKPPPNQPPGLVPVQGVSLVAESVAGDVTIQVPGQKAQPLDAPRLVPVRTRFDSRAGKVRITAATDATTAMGIFHDGIFVANQSKTSPPVTLKLEGVDPLCNSSVSVARAAARKRVRRRLWGNAHGAFRTRGHSAAASVRGTRWLLVDGCLGTRVSVVRGVVDVNDFGKDTTVSVTAGHDYFARATCKSRRRFTIRLRLPAGLTVRSATVAVGGRKFKLRSLNPPTAHVDLRKLPAGRYTARIRAVTTTGRVLTGTRVYHTCSTKLPSHGPPPL